MFGQSGFRKPLRIDVDDITDGLDEELQEGQDVVVFTIESQERERDVWKISVRADERRRVPLDEGFEGQTAWWPGPPRGAADVLSVVPEEFQINLRFATQPPPGAGERIFIYAPKYLEPLKNVWKDAIWPRRCEEWLETLQQQNSFDRSRALSPDGVPVPLRAAQRSAFALTGWHAGFLWGPPGTGKTYTLGALLAAYLLRFPGSRVLLLSTTNSAIDQAVVAADKSLEAYGTDAMRTRKQCQRVGNHFTGSAYVGREHLLPVPNPDLVKQLTALEAKRPNPEDVVAYADWKRAVEDIRARLRAKATSVLDGARLAAVTTTAAAFLMEVLRRQKPYDLMVFDEASQIGLAHALALAPLARHTIFAGDPRQLQPIVQSERDAPRRWLGESIFSVMREDHESTCFLNEQSRMVEPICEVVSGAFYSQRLVVAEEAKRSASWREFRNRGDGNRWQPPHIWVENDLPPGTWSSTYGGPIRYESTEWVVGHVDELVRGVGEDGVLILTPFRAQRALMRKRLRDIGRRGVRVSTIHRAQGSEVHTVVFDPVDGSSKFFEEFGDRLTNVAISRAQARLVVLFSADDLENPKLRQVSELIRLRSVAAGRSISDVPSICEWVARPGFPQMAVGSLVAIGSAVGELQQADAENLVLRDSLSGGLRRFKLAVVLAQCNGALARREPPASERAPSPPVAPPPLRPAATVRRGRDGSRLVVKAGNPTAAEKGVSPGTATQFQQALIDLNQRMKRTVGRGSPVLMRMITTMGAVEAARQLLSARTPSETFADLVAQRRYDLTIEYLVLDRRWRELFSEAHREIARRKLEDAGYR